MGNNEVTSYYLIKKRLLGKRVVAEKSIRDYLYKNGAWEPDTEHAISDRLIGYDPYEPPGSPYRIGCTIVMNEIESISPEQAQAWLL